MFRRKEEGHSAINYLLLLLMIIRIIPFDLLHYHNKEFANLTSLSLLAQPSTQDTTLDEVHGGCNFHQYLHLQTTSFVFEASTTLFIPPEEVQILGVNPFAEPNAYASDTLNKGSPVLV